MFRHRCFLQAFNNETGREFTLTLNDAESLHIPFVPVTTKVVVVTGEATGLDIVAEERLDIGDHEYVAILSLRFSETVSPLQIVNSRNG